MESTVTIRKAVKEDRAQVAEMRFLLWPDGPLEEHLSEFDVQLATGMSGTLPAVTLVAQDADGTLVGFVEVGLRSHADGCDPQWPTGFIEGWYVREDLRNRGIGKGLVREAEDWARGQGCKEMASDAVFDNYTSLAAHEALGFEVVDRCFHFRKAL
jgi:aminoglycoside 6'-N-acetyltransferase I